MADEIRTTQNTCLTLAYRMYFVCNDYLLNVGGLMHRSKHCRRLLDSIAIASAPTPLGGMLWEFQDGSTLVANPTECVMLPVPAGYVERPRVAMVITDDGVCRVPLDGETERMRAAAMEMERVVREFSKERNREPR